MRFTIALLLSFVLCNSIENQPTDNLNEPIDIEAKKESKDNNDIEMPDFD